MLSIGLEKSLRTRKAAGAFARGVGTTKYVSSMREPMFREGEIPGVVEIFKDDVKVGTFMTIEVAKYGEFKGIGSRINRGADTFIGGSQ